MRFSNLRFEENTEDILMSEANNSVELPYIRPNYTPSTPEESTVEESKRLQVAEAFRNADRLIIVIGGSSVGREKDLGALGETVLLSGFLKASLAALRKENKSIPITFIVDESLKGLYN